MRIAFFQIKDLLNGVLEINEFLIPEDNFNGYETPPTITPEIIYKLDEEFGEGKWKVNDFIGYKRFWFSHEQLKRQEENKFSSRVKSERPFYYFYVTTVDEKRFTESKIGFNVSAYEDAVEVFFDKGAVEARRVLMSADLFECKSLSDIVEKHIGSDGMGVNQSVDITMEEFLQKVSEKYKKNDENDINPPNSTIT